MLKLTVEAGEYLMIGDDIKVVFTGGTSRHARVLVDAPRAIPIVRSAALKGKGEAKGYRREKEISQEAKAKIHAILSEELKKS